MSTKYKKSPVYYKNYTGEELTIIRFIDESSIVIDEQNEQIFTEDDNCEYATLYPSGYLCLEEKQEFIVRIDSWKAHGMLYEEIELPEESEGVVYILEPNVFSKLVGLDGRTDLVIPSYPVISSNTNTFLGYNGLTYGRLKRDDTN